MSLKGLAGFNLHYEKIYGDRWPALLAALNSPVRQVARQNLFSVLIGNASKISTEISTELTSPSSENERTSVFGEKSGTVFLSKYPGQKFIEVSESNPVSPKTNVNGLTDFYLLDAASIFAAAALEVKAGDHVLDLCAAPGGKALIFAEAIQDSGVLVANELSDKRRARLRSVFNNYLPEFLLRSGRVRVTGFDGTKWCLHETDAFDRILVDAPCSGERHLLVDSEEMKLWSPARSKNLAIRQYALLASAHKVVRSGGRIVYSTCSISPKENDEIVARLLKKRRGEVKILSSDLSVFAPELQTSLTELSEQTEFGRQILPDKSGFGPIYFSVMERL